MNELTQWAHQNPVYLAVIVTAAHHMFDAAIDSMPAPQPTSSPFYQFIHNFLNKVAGNYRQKDK